MFQTYNQAEVNIPPSIAEPDTKTWWYVGKHLHTHWFQVTYEVQCNDADFSLSHILFMDQLDQLVELASHDINKIRSVYLVSPCHINNSEDWKMEPLAEIWESEEPEYEGQSVQIFVLTNGNRYVDSSVGTTEKELLKKKIIIKI